MRFAFLLLLLLGACSEDGHTSPAAPGSPAEASAKAGAPSRPDRATWWNAATGIGTGGERVLCPRELRGLLEEGHRFGFDADAEWWGRRTAWASERILQLDPEDVEANAMAGRRSLQSIEGFDALWRRMIETRAPSQGITELLDRYDPWVEEGRPIFLTREEFALEQARLKDAAAHLARVEEDKGYAAEQRELLRASVSAHGAYPFLHVRVGPFLVFYVARDLARDPEADPAEEDARLAARREIHLRKLAEWTSLYADLIKDMRTLFPEAWEAHPLDADDLMPQWVFGDHEWYLDFTSRVRRDEEEAPYRVGFLQTATGSAYLAEPTEEAGMDAFRETAAYLGALQILRIWSQDAGDPTLNHWDRSEDYWFKEGLPAFLASRLVAKPVEGEVLGGPWEMPRLDAVVQRRGRLARGPYLMPREGTEVDPAQFAPDGGYTDIAWLLVRHLSAAKKAQFERFLRAQIEGTGKGIGFFEDCFDVKGSAAWGALQRATYGSIE